MSEAPVRPRRQALVSQVIDLLRQNISSGQWAVGDRIPTEGELSETFGISRITLRQAVQALVHVGLLETIQGSGTFVRATTEIEAVVSRYLSSEEIGPVLELRQALESHAAQLAARRASQADIAAMQTAVDAGRAAVEAGDVPATSRASVDFHRAVIRASGNVPLGALYAALESAVLDSIERSTSAEGPDSFVQGHADILDAIRSGDARAAHERAEDHLASTLE